jgi:hypothetical protein
MKTFKHTSSSRRIPVSTNGFRILIISLAIITVNILAVTLFSRGIMAQPIPGVAPTIMPTGGCAIDGDLIAGIPTTPPFAVTNGDFLESNISGTGGGIFTNPGGLPIGTEPAFHLIDVYGNSGDDVFRQGSKFSDDPNTWHWKAQSAPDKNDINNALFHFSTDANNHIWFMGGGDRYSGKGDSRLNFAFYQDMLVKNADGTFSSDGPDGGRTVGDIMISIDYIGGGTIPVFVAYMWTETSTNVFSYQVLTPTGGWGSKRFATPNMGITPIDVPFGAFGSFTYPQFTYTEVALDLNAVIPGLTEFTYFKTLFIFTDASDETNAELKDFIDPLQLVASLGDRVVLDGVCPPEYNPALCPGFGIQDAGEQGVPNVLVSLYTCADVFVSSMLTDANGYYLFTNLNPGSYYVIFTQLPPNRSFSAQDVGSDDSKDSDANPFGKTDCVTLTAGENNLTVDAIIYNSKTCPQFVIVCPPDIELPCNGTVPDPDPTSVTWDPDPDCIFDPVVVTFISDVSTLNGCIETITRTYKAEEASGKIAYCSHNITRKVDNDPPVISGVGGPQTINCPSTPVFSEPTAFDNCDGALIVPLPFVDETMPGACDALYTITRKWTATDACGKSSTANQTITVIDKSCPPASTITPVVDGLLDPSYQFFKNISNNIPLNNNYTRATVYKFEDATTLYLAYVESRAVNDNVYGPLPSDVTYAGWGNPNYHVWDNLVGSDRVEIQLLNTVGTLVFDVTFDYLFPQFLGTLAVSYNSGLSMEVPLGLTAGAFYDGSPVTALGYGNVIKSQTSEDFNQICVPMSVFETNSPGPPESSYPCWEYRYIYEVAISKAGLDLTDPFTDPNKLIVPLVHNSPNKSAPGISGFKYCDANNNGAWDPGEAGLGGWQIDLAGPTNAFTTTDANGHYEFFNVAPGLYTLTEVSQSGYVQTQSPVTFILGVNEVVTDKNFGNNPTCCPTPPPAMPLVTSDPSQGLTNVKNIDILIAPNPFTDATDVTIISKVKTQATVEIYNFMGVKVKTLFVGTLEADVKNSFRFSVESYQPEQIFLCVVRTPQGREVQRIIKIN